MATAEETRLDQGRAHTAYWKRWEPYLSERQWGTVREDYSENGDAWNYSLTTRRDRVPIAGKKTTG